jgi:hypothetical protein
VLLKEHGGFHHTVLSNFSSLRYSMQSLIYDLRHRVGRSEKEQRVHVRGEKPRTSQKKAALRQLPESPPECVNFAEEPPGWFFNVSAFFCPSTLDCCDSNTCNVGQGRGADHPASRGEGWFF